MIDDDVTRLIESPQGASDSIDTSSLDPGTPCVGVASMGHTHFGETELRRVPSADLGARPSSEERSSTVPAVRRKAAALPSAARALPRSWASLVGVCLGLTMALVVVGRRATPEPQVRSLPPVNVLVMVEADGEPLENVPVRVGTHVAFSDENGRADLSLRPSGESLEVEAKCPSGFSGELSRSLSQAVFDAGRSWTLRLDCDPHLIRSLIPVRTRECGEVDVLIDGKSYGTTKNGALDVSLEHRDGQTIEIRATSPDQACRIDEIRRVTLTKVEPPQEELFVGVRARPVRRATRKKLHARPYRL